MVMNNLTSPSPAVFSELTRTIDVNSVPDDKKAAILVPALVILRDSRYCRSANLVISAFDYAKKVLEKLTPERAYLALPRDILVEFFVRIGTSCDQSAISQSDISEIKLASYAFGEILLASADDSALEYFYIAKNLPAMGHVVSLLISSIEDNNSSPSLRLAAFRMLRLLISSRSHVINAQISVVALTFMPGILSTLANILKLGADPHVNHNMLIESLEVLKNVVTLVLNTDNVDDLQAKERFCRECPENIFHKLAASGILPHLPLSREHLKSVGQRVSPVIAMIFKPTLFSSEETIDARVRRVAFVAAGAILQKSATFLPIGEACSALLNCVSAAAVEEPDTCGTSVDQLDGVLLAMPELGDLAEDSFIEMIRELPNFLNGQSIKFEVNLCGRLASLIGYARLLGRCGRLSRIFTSETILMELFRCLNMASQLQPFSLTFLNLAPAPPTSEMLAHSILMDAEFWVSRFPRQLLPFKYLNSNATRQLFEKLIETLIQQVDDPYDLVSYFYDIMTRLVSDKDVEDFRLESSCYVLSLLLTKSSIENKSSSSLAEALVERFCGESFQFSSNRAAMLLLGACAQSSASSSESNLLIIRRSILALLEACSSGKPFVENHALHTLADVARASGAETLAYFIEQNADYLADAFVLRLRHLSVSRQTLYAMAAAFRFSSPPCLSFFADPLREIIHHLPDCDYDHELTELLLLAGNNAMAAIFRWNLAYEEKPSFPSLDEEEAPNEFSPIAKPQGDVQIHIALARDMADAVLNLFSSHQTNIRISALETARFCIMIVRPATNELLPLVHRLWPGVCARFIPHENRKQVILKALDLLLALAESSGEFIRHRFATAMLNSVCQEIHRLSQMLEKTGIRLTVYRQTFDYKLLVRLVADVPRLAHLVKITKTSDLETIFKAVLSALTVSIKLNRETESLKSSALAGACQLLKEPDSERPNTRKCIRDMIQQLDNETNIDIFNILKTYL